MRVDFFTTATMRPNSIKTLTIKQIMIMHARVSIGVNALSLELPKIKNPGVVEAALAYGHAQKIRKSRKKPKRITLSTTMTPAKHNSIMG